MVALEDAMKRAHAFLLAICACSHVAAEQRIDAASSDGAPDSAPALRCNPSSPFGAPMAISEINTDASEEGAYLSPDELTMYFSSNRSGTLGGYDIFMATRPTRTAPWRDIVPVTGVNTSTGNERRPMVAGDELTMYAEIGVSPNVELGIATRRSVDLAFTSLAAAATINGGSNDISGTIIPDQSAIWFSSIRTGNYELYRALRSSGQFAAPRLVDGTNINVAAAVDTNPVVTPDERTLYFSSTRPGGDGGLDIWLARYNSVTNGFDAPENLGTVNTDGTEAPSWVSDDGCVLLLFGGPTSDYDLYVATRGM
jgi:hypothetical protein